MSEENLSYDELQRRITELQAIADRKLREEKGAVIAVMREKIARYGITASELGFGGDGRLRSTRSSAAPSVKLSAGKYRHPETGEIYEYGGRGRKMPWIARMSAEEIEACRVG